MPVWHELTRPWRDSGELRVVGLIQEQHPERCRLFAQWEELDWPILWDPFGLTGSRAVPNVVAVDEFGVVRAVDPRPETFEEEFLRRDFAPPGPDVLPAEVGVREAAVVPGSSGGEPASLEAAIAGLLWPGDAPLAPRVDALVRHADEHPGDAAAAFRAGVALRMRYDSDEHRPGDFQDAIDLWQRALDLDPNQYIWRRRIQQYGPRMDKPYNFYSWTEKAVEEIRQRGEEPVALRVELTPAELAFPRPAFAQPERREPDPEGRIDRDEAGLVHVESAVAFSTSEGPVTASVHLALRPDAGLDAHWNNEAGPLVIWIGADGVPPGWSLSERRIELPPDAPPATSEEVRRFTFEVELPERTSTGRLACYVLFYACEGAGGKCRYLRRDFAVTLGEG